MREREGKAHVCLHHRSHVAGDERRVKTITMAPGAVLLTQLGPCVLNLTLLGRVLLLLYPLSTPESVTAYKQGWTRCLLSARTRWDAATARGRSWCHCQRVRPRLSLSGTWFSARRSSLSQRTRSVVEAKRAEPLGQGAPKPRPRLGRQASSRTSIMM